MGVVFQRRYVSLYGYVILILIYDKRIFQITNQNDLLFHFREHLKRSSYFRLSKKPLQHIQLMCHTVRVFDFKIRIFYIIIYLDIYFTNTFNKINNEHLNKTNLHYSYIKRHLYFELNSQFYGLMADPLKFDKTTK